MSLTPFGSRYDDPYGDDGLDLDDFRYGLPRWDDPLDGYYDDFAAELDAIGNQTDQCYPSYDVPHETELAWKQYEEDHRPVTVADEVHHLTNTEVLDARLADMTWLHARHRRTSALRNGRRYKVAGDHGTAIARKQITATRRERLRKARQNRHTKHYTPDWKFRAQREGLTTWGVARVEMSEIAEMSISHGLFHLFVTDECTDERCCPVVLDPWEDDLFDW